MSLVEISPTTTRLAVSSELNWTLRTRTIRLHDVCILRRVSLGFSVVFGVWGILNKRVTGHSDDTPETQNSVSYALAVCNE